MKTGAGEYTYELIDDFAKLPELLKEARAALGKSAPKEKRKEEKVDEPKQMNLF